MAVGVALALQQRPLQWSHQPLGSGTLARHEALPSRRECRSLNLVVGVCSAANSVFVLISESVSIPKNPRTDKPVGYAFVDLSTPSEAERAINELSGKEILERKVSVQLARKPESNDKTEAGAAGEGSGGEGTRRRASGRGRGRGRGRGGRGGRGVS